MKWEEIILSLKGITSCVEVRQDFSARMCHHREVDETDIQTLDRLLGELKKFRSKEEDLEELLEMDGFK